MKKLAFLFIILFIAGALSACGGGSSAPSVETPPAENVQTSARSIQYREGEDDIIRSYASGSVQLNGDGGVVVLTLSQADYDTLQGLLRDYRARRPEQYSFEYRNAHEAQEILGRLDYVKGDVYELAQAHTATRKDLSFTPGANGGTVQISLSRFHADRLEDLRADYREAEANPMTNTIGFCEPHVWGHYHYFPAVGDATSCHLKAERENHGSREGKYGLGTINQIVTTTVTRLTAIVQRVEQRSETVYQVSCCNRQNSIPRYTLSVTSSFLQIDATTACLSVGNCKEQGYSDILQVVHNGHTLILLHGTNSSLRILNSGGGAIGVSPSESDEDLIERVNNPPTFERPHILIQVAGMTISLRHGTIADEYPTVYAAITLDELPMGLALSAPPPKPKHYYTLETRNDDVWATDNGFAFNMRGIISAAEGVHLQNFSFVGENPAHDAHLEYRANPLTLMGIGVYADTGFKWENGGETQAHYGKMMAVYPLFAVPDNDGDNKNRAALEWDLYASAAVGKVHSSYYEDSRLFGFAAGSFVRHLFGETDEWHLRFRRPLSATEIRPLVFGADMRVGGEESHWRFGLERDLDSGDLDATANWRFEF